MIRAWANPVLGSATSQKMLNQLWITAGGVKVETGQIITPQELLTRHPWLRPYGGALLGWNGLIDELATQIEMRYAEQKIALSVETLHLRQVKEKFGELRFYCVSAVPIQDLIQNATLKSTWLCQECGSAGCLMQNERRWLRTLCDKHATDEYTARPSLKKVTVDGVTFTFFEEGQLDAVMPSYYLVIR